MKAGEARTAPPAPVMSAVVRTTTPVRVLNEATPTTLSATAFSTKAVVASCPSEDPCAGVGAVGTPVKFGLSSGA